VAQFLTYGGRVISGHLVVEGLLIAVIVFQLSRKSYKPPKKPLTEKVRLFFFLQQSSTDILMSKRSVLAIASLNV
jgi:hypothetical protein